MTLVNAITRLAAIEASLAGVAKAYEYTPESLGVFPSWINYIDRGEQVFAPGGYRLHTLISRLYVARGDLSLAESTARPYIDLFLSALESDPTLDGTVSSVNAVRYRYGWLPFGTDQYCGVEFQIDVKIRSGL